VTSPEEVVSSLHKATKKRKRPDNYDNPSDILNSQMFAEIVSIGHQSAPAQQVSVFNCHAVLRHDESCLTQAGLIPSWLAERVWHTSAKIRQEFSGHHAQ
jgi:hypothetical protein